MNVSQDFDAFCTLLDDYWALKGQALTAGARLVFFETLEAYPLREVAFGLKAHFRDPKRGQFLPMPADVIAQIATAINNDGRPGAEEAWATAIRASDEAATVVWTAETAEAWAIAKPVLDLGDEVGARMAFKEAYTRLIAESRTLGIPPAWNASLGHDPARRQDALQQAAAAGLLPAPDVTGLLPAPRGSASAAPAVLEMLRGLRDRLAAKPEPVSPDAAAKESTAAAKAEVQRRVDEYERGK